MRPTLRLILRRIRDDWKEVIAIAGPYVVALAFGLAVYLTSTSLPGRVLDSLVLRRWFDLRGERPIPSNVSIVWVDTEAYRLIGVPIDGMIPRRVLADATMKVASAGAKAVVLDFFFIAEGEDKEGDYLFAKALKQTPSVIGRAVTIMTRTDYEGNQQTSFVHKRPLEQFATSATDVVLLQVVTEPSGKVERIALPEPVVAPMGVRVPLLRPVRRLIRSEVEEPSAYDLINFYGPAFRLPGISLASVIKDFAEVPKDYFKDRVVFM